MDVFQILVVILAIALAVFLALGIALAIILIRISRKIKHVVSNVEDISNNLCESSRNVRTITASVSQLVLSLIHI